MDTKDSILAYERYDKKHCPKCDGKIKLPKYCQDSKWELLCRYIKIDHLHWTCEECHYEFLSYCQDYPMQQIMMELKS